MATVVNGSRCRVILNGQEISGMVRSVQIRAAVGECVLTQMEFIAAPLVRFGDDGVYEIVLNDTGPAVGPLDAPGLPAGMRIRAMQLVGDIPSS